MAPKQNPKWFETTFGIVLVILIGGTILYLLAWIVLSGAIPPT